MVTVDKSLEGELLSPEPLLHLVYAVTFRYVPQGEESPHLLVLYVDAADGSLIGGAETA